MAIRIGATLINAKRLGANALNKIMLGAVEIFPNIGAAAIPTPEDLFTGANQGLYYDLDDDMDEKMAWVASNPSFTPETFLAQFPKHALFQESRGVIPVTGPTQPLGLVLDKSDTSEWGEVIPTIEDWAGQWQNTSANWTVTSDAISWNGSGASSTETVWLPLYLDESYKDRYVKLTFTISNYSGTGDCGVANGTLSYLPNDTTAANIVFSSVSANGTYTMYGYWRGGGAADGRTLNAFGRTTHSFTLSNVKVEKAFGKHFACVTTANRFQWNVGRMTYNGVNSRGTAYAVQFAPVVDYSFFMGVTCRNTTVWPEVYTFGAEGISWGDTQNIGGFHFQQGQCLPHLNGEADPPRRNYMQTQPVIANEPISLAYKFNYGAGLPNAGMPFYQSYGGGVSQSFSRVGVAQVGSVPSGNFNMGGVLQGGSAVLDGDVYQFVLVFRDTTPDETADTQGFINNKLGITP